MAGFKQLSGLVVPLDAANVDTDAIIPKQFLQAITRVGFGKHLLHEWRYLDVEGTKPNPAEMTEPVTRASAEKALNYIGLEPNTDLKDIPVDQVFIGSCTNARIEDLRAAAAVMKGRKKADNVKRILVVPGSGLVKEQAEKEGLDKIFIEAGAEWRNPGCSMCLGMNDDRLGEWERCASTSNRNFEGRQGRNGRTHLVSPAMAAAAGMFGKFVDIRDVTLN